MSERVDPFRDFPLTKELCMQTRCMVSCIGSKAMQQVLLVVALTRIHVRSAGISNGVGNGNYNAGGETL